MNVDLAQTVLDHIRSHPEEHDQGIWGHKTSCGTFACFAGWALIFADEDNWGMPENHVDDTLVTAKDGQTVEHELCNNAWSEAGELLGLEGWQADVLFAPYVTLPKIERLLYRWSGGAVR